MSHVPDETAYRNVTIEHGRARLAELEMRWGRRQAVPAHWLNATPDSDLRTVIDPEAEGVDYNDGLLQRASHALLTAGDQFDLSVFLHSADGQSVVMDPHGYTGYSVGNQPLGPLADLQVYATDPYGRSRGQFKSHGLCIHEKYLHSGHELLTLEEFVPLYQQDPGGGPWSGSGWCSKCAGYAVRRLAAEQFAHYRASVRKAEAG